MRVEVVRHESEVIWGERVLRAAHPRLARFMSGYEGFDERSAGRVTRVESPIGGLPLIVSFGPEMRLSGPGGVGVARHRSFVVGLHESWVRTELEREWRGVQIDLTPLGGFRLFGRPMHELANRVVALADLLGDDGRVLGERMAEAASWERRFAILDDALLARFARAAPPSEAIDWAWQRLVDSAGAVRIGALAERLGYSRKHLVARFRAEVGLAPKALARVLRFERAERLLRRPGADAGDVAARCGYYDQSHLIRDFREFAGTTPGARPR